MAHATQRVRSSTSAPLTADTYNAARDSVRMPSRLYPGRRFTLSEVVGVKLGGWAERPSTRELDADTVAEGGSDDVLADGSAEIRSVRATPPLPWAACLCVCIVFPLLVFGFLQPDWYYILNGLDSFFYTGYAQALGEVIQVSGTKHYFVSRWPVYWSNHVFFRMFGAEHGFLILRLLAAAIIVGAILALGRRRWRATDCLALCVLVLVTPMVIRGVLTDYSDFVTVPIGIAMIVTLARAPTSSRAAFAFGGGAALIGISNPIAVSVAFCFLPGWIVYSKGTKRQLRAVLLAAVGAVTVIGLGFVLFRLRYGIANVYAPEVSFIRDSSSLQDPLKSPRLWWMGYRIWIYLPALVLLTWRYLVHQRAVLFDRTESLILSTCACQYLFQIWFQFSRHGSTLEIPYYWSLMVPSLVLSLIVIVGKISFGASKYALPCSIIVLVLYLRLERYHIGRLYGSWIDAFLLVAVIALAWHKLGNRASSFACVAMVFIFVTFQVSAPRPEPALPGELRVQANYEGVFDSRDSQGIEAFRAASWFRATLSGLGDQITTRTYFYVSGGDSQQMVAMYSAHVDGRLLSFAGLDLPPDSAALVRSGVPEIVTLVGPADQMTLLLQNIQALNVSYETVFTATAPDRAQTEVMVLENREHGG